MSDEQRRDARKQPQPEGIRPIPVIAVSLLLGVVQRLHRRRRFVRSRELASIAAAGSIEMGSVLAAS